MNELYSFLKLSQDRSCVELRKRREEMRGKKPLSEKDGVNDRGDGELESRENGVKEYL